MSVVGVIIIYSILAYLEVVPMVKERQMKRTGLYLGMIIVSLGFSIYLLLDLPVIHLTNIVEMVIERFIEVK